MPGGLFRRLSCTVSGSSGAITGLRAATTRISAKATIATTADLLRNSLRPSPWPRPVGATAPATGTAAGERWATSATSFGPAHDEKGLQQGRGIEVAQAHGHGRLSDLRVDGHPEERCAHLPRLFQQQLRAVQRLSQRALWPVV